jgi:hypothetical protein
MSTDQYGADALIQRLVDTMGNEQSVRAWVRDLLAEDDDIAHAALHWGRDGIMPDRPEVEGYTPASLAPGRPPTQVFALLRFLRNDPDGARRVLRRAPDVGLRRG